MDTTDRLVADRYALGDLLGRGGMGQVWRAQDVLLGREVAVKEVVLPATMSDEERDVLRARVMREARAAARLNHRASVTVFDVVEDGGNIFLVMELVECGSLSDLVESSGPLPAERAASIGLEVLDALEAAHVTGVVHRDVKPSNVLVLENGSVKLSDFGIASLQDDPRITSTGMILGSPSYMAPEQAEGDEGGPATDIWGLGATLYYAVEGEAPFGKGEPLPTMHAVVHEEPRPFRLAGPLRGAIAAMLAKDPTRRPDDGTVRRMLEEAVNGSADSATAAATTVAAPEVTRTERMPEPAVAAAPMPVAEERVRPARRDHAASPGRSLSWLVVVLVVALLAGVLLLATRGGDDDGNDDDQTAAAPADETATTAARSVSSAATRHHVDRNAGYELNYPRGWTVARVSGTATDFRAPDGTYLRVDWTSKPGDSPEQAWIEQAASFAQRHTGYREIDIRPLTFKGHKAAEWEFTYAEGGATLHAIDLGFVTDNRGYALNFQTRQDRWEESQPLFEQLKASFKVIDAGGD